MHLANFPQNGTWSAPKQLTVRVTPALVSFAPLAFKLFYAARQNAVLRRSHFPSHSVFSFLFSIRKDSSSLSPPFLKLLICCFGVIFIICFSEHVLITYIYFFKNIFYNFSLVFISVNMNRVYDFHHFFVRILNIFSG